MQQLGNAASFVAACTGIRERVLMAGWLGRLAVSRALRRRGQAIVTLPFRGLRLCLDWASSEHVPVREVLIRGDYWPEEPFRPALGQTVVDVGANAGVYAVYAARQVGPGGRVIAIEPNPAVVARLERNIRRNGLDRICTVVPVAVSSGVGSGALVVGANTTIGRLDDTGRIGITVPVSTLDAIVGDLGVERIDLVKIDVEGSEVAVLHGAAETLQRARRIVIEVSDATSVSIADGLRAAGFGRVFTLGAGRDSGGALVFAEREPS